METILQVEQLNQNYRKGEPVLSGISFRLAGGEALGVTGSNGAGKSTLIRILAGLLKPDGGRVLFRGTDTASPAGKKAFRARMGYVPQDIALYPELTGYDNLYFFGKANHVEGKVLKARIRDVCVEIGMKEADLKKKTGYYSGGMKRRLNLGAALLHEPELLLLDEPTAGIDDASRRAILAALKKKRDSGMSLIYVGHDREEIDFLCTRRGRIEGGKWAEDGTAVECGAD